MKHPRESQNYGLIHTISYNNSHPKLTLTKTEVYREPPDRVRLGLPAGDGV